MSVMKLIDKDALVAEIERLIKHSEMVADHNTQITELVSRELDTLYHLISFTNSLEVKEIGVDLGDPKGDKSAKYIIDTKNLEAKEVDLETQIEDYINSHFTEGCDGGMISDWYKVLGGVHYKDLVEIAKHFFELGLKAQRGE